MPKKQKAMSEDQFWALIDEISELASTQGLPSASNKVLSTRTRAELLDFGAWALAFERHSPNRKTSAASALINRGESGDDAERNFYAWIVLRGKDFWKSALEDPDALSIETDEYATAPNFIVLAAEAYSIRTGAEKMSWDRLEYIESKFQQRLISRDFDKVSRQLYSFTKAIDKKVAPDRDDWLVQIYGADYFEEMLPRLWAEFKSEWCGPSLTVWQDLNVEDEELSELDYEIEQLLDKEIDNRVVEYALSDENGDLVNKLNERAFSGKIQFVREADPTDPESKVIESEVLEDPTWLDLTKLANRMIDSSRDPDHIYLEGIDIQQSGDVSKARFLLGS